MSTTVPILSTLELSVERVPGFSSLDQLMTLFTLAYSSANLEGDVLELGSWCGRSAVALGLAAKLTGNAKVYCVDLFPEEKDWRRNTDGSYSFEVNINGKSYAAYDEQTVWAEPYEKYIAPVYQNFSGALDVFKKTIDNNGLSPWVVPFKGDLASFVASKVTESLALRMVFIDGDHSYSAVMNDIAIVERYLVSGGWICFDDAFSSYPGVNRAIEESVLNSGKYHQCQQLTRKFFVARRK